jgi:hypothetical protein
VPFLLDHSRELRVMIKRRNLLHQRKFIISCQPMLKIFQTTWTQSTQLSHNQLVLELEEPHSMLKLKKKILPLRSINITRSTTTKPRISEITVSSRRSTDSHQLTRAFFHNHGEDHRLHTQSMDSRTHLSNGWIRNHWLRRSTIITITTWLRILVTMVSLKKSTDSPLLTRASCHNHGEELRKHTQLMDSRTHLGNGSIRNPWLRRSTSTTTNTIIKLKTSVTMVSLKKSTDSPQLTRAFSHNHGEDLRLHIQSTDSRTHLSNGSSELDLRRQLDDICI